MGFLYPINDMLICDLSDEIELSIPMRENDDWIGYNKWSIKILDNA